jgi:NH3-dependent NAD+ synthetase
LSEVLDQGGDATVVADLMTDEEQDEDDADADCPFDQVDHVDGKMMKEEEEEEEEEDDDDDDVDFPSNAFCAEWKARHDATVVADELTDEEDDDFSSPFDYAFLAKLEERHEEEFQELLAEMMI